MASGLRRLGPFLSTIPRILRVLDATAAPRGGERAAATALRAWCAARWPEIDWIVQPYGRSGANLVATHGTGPLLYSHLDTSLDSAPADAAVTGRADPAGRLRVSGEQAEGFGLGVARAPAAAALAAFAEAGSGTLLLAGSGTHRRGSAGTGLEAYLDAYPPPPAAIVAKSGPATVLWEEPGALYLRVRLTGRYGAVLARRSAVPEGGVIAHIGVVVDALEAWCHGYARSRPGVGQVGATAGIGAIRAGRPDKPDLFPASLELDLYVVTVPGESPDALAEEVERRVRTVCAGTPLGVCAVSVEVDVVHAAAATPRGAAIVTAAWAAWTEEFGAEPPPITGWTGSTDGVVLRGRGVDTVRLGPQAVPSEDDPRRDVVDLVRLAAYSRLYRRLIGV
ncbi:hypothetical protein [Rhizohabitans arisaemae]|uniref:hypothetical protein n=1 Tax=Rhizohabitans arisaemae TaxID=2720610 RepID=UPI0024B1D2E3|nr:hypothetical protein [Rhizohabitans arisaemae]